MPRLTIIIELLEPELATPDGTLKAHEIANTIRRTANIIESSAPEPGINGPIMVEPISGPRPPQTRSGYRMVGAWEIIEE